MLIYYHDGVVLFIQTVLGYIILYFWKIRGYLKKSFRIKNIYIYEINLH